VASVVKDKEEEAKKQNVEMPEIDYAEMKRKLRDDDDLFVPIVIADHEEIFSRGLLTNWEQTELEIDGLDTPTETSNQVIVWEVKGGRAAGKARDQLKVHAYLPCFGLIWCA